VGRFDPACLGIRAHGIKIDMASWIAPGGPRAEREPAVTDSQMAALRALLDRLIPADDFAGALEAGVDRYILGQWRGDCASEAPVLLAGLAALDGEASARHGPGRSLAALEPEERDALLADLENGQAAAAWPAEISAAAFFRRMTELAHEGFYADPGNGGNRDAAAWRMIRYDPGQPKPAGPA
jgi:hypothetical protein